MAVVFVPPIVLVFLVHEALELSEPARNIVAVLIGLVFSSVIAVPLRAFLLVPGRPRPTRQVRRVTKRHPCRRCSRDGPLSLLSPSRSYPAAPAAARAHPGTRAANGP